MRPYMELEATNDQELAEIKAKIEKARAWARKHFRADRAETCSFFDIAFFVEFPGPDTMRVTPSFGGKHSELWIYYRLCFKSDGGLGWRGIHPLYNTPLPPLIVTLQNDGIEGG